GMLMRCVVDGGCMRCGGFAIRPRSQAGDNLEDGDIGALPIRSIPTGSACRQGQPHVDGREIYPGEPTREDTGDRVKLGRKPEGLADYARRPAEPPLP